jgi:hypothetical protein
MISMKQPFATCCRLTLMVERLDDLVCSKSQEVPADGCARFWFH